MGKTSWEAKDRYNRKAYKRFVSQIKPDLFERIDKYCKAQGLSRSQFLAKAIDLMEHE